jgi:hypothetical protein
LETSKFLVIELSDVESHGDEVKWIDALCFVVAFEVHEECFFVGEIPVVCDVVVNFEVSRTVFVVFHFVP